MFEKYFKSIIMSLLGEYIKDFTSDDIKVNKWNGVVIKEDIVLKSTALMSLSKLVGLPLDVIDGSAKAIKITIPWSNIWKEPIEVLIEDIYALCTVREGYSKRYAEDLILASKEEIICKIKENIPSELMKDDENNEKKGLLYGYIRTILDNIQLKISNIHLKIEDTGVSVKNRFFSFGIICESIEYYHVAKKILLKQNLADEQLSKQVLKLSFNGISLYWSNHENYIIRPLNIVLLDSSLTITPIIVSLDITIVSYLKSLMNLINFHSQNIENKLAYIHRPGYLCTVKDSPKQFWKFAIANVINIIRHKSFNENKNIRQREMSNLVEMLKLQSIQQLNPQLIEQYHNSIGTDKLIIFEDTDKEMIFENIKTLENNIRRIKLLLNVEYLAICMSKAEKEFLIIKRRLERNAKNSK